jgi:hypothetical protein
MVGSKEVLLQKSLKENAAHFTCAKHSDADVGELREDFLFRYRDFGHVGFLVAALSLFSEYLFAGRMADLSR